MTNQPGEPIALRSLANLRELGHWQGRDGRRVAARLLYRSTRLATLDDADTGELVARGIGTVIDLRTEEETATEPDRPLPGATNVSLDVLADSTLSSGADLTKLLDHPREITALLAGGAAKEFMTAAYREIVTLPSALAAYRTFFDLVEGAEAPVLFHCTTGKDRTGWGAAMILHVLGVHRDDITTEYLLTNDQLLPRFDRALTAFEAAGGDPDVLRPVLGVDASYLQASFDTADAEFGSLEAYLIDGLGLTDQRQERLRSRYLTD